MIHHSVTFGFWFTPPVEAGHLGLHHRWQTSGSESFEVPKANKHFQNDFLWLGWIRMRLTVCLTKHLLVFKTHSDYQSWSIFPASPPTVRDHSKTWPYRSYLQPHSPDHVSIRATRSSIKKETNGVPKGSPIARKEARSCGSAIQHPTLRT